MKAAFAKALRVTDWAHFLGACSRPKKSFDAPCERIAAYRAGVIATMKKHLSTFGQKLVPLIERAIFCFRSLPTALLFHTVIHVLLQTLLAQQPSERPAAKAFRKHYLSLLSEEEAKSAYGLANWPGGPDMFYTADWWCGIQRIQPGSASGTQAQESWHGQKLKKYMGLRQSLPVFVQSLSSFASSRLQNLRASNTSLTDVPNEPFPDKAVLFDSNALTQQGRTSAEQFHRTGATKRWDDGHGSVFLCTRRTLATFDRAATKWIRSEDTEVTPPPASFPETFASLLRSTSDAAVTQALVALGLGPEPLEDVEKLVKTLQSYVLVVVGPAASEFWCRQPSDSDSTPHAQAICAFCQTFCLHGFL